MTVHIVRGPSGCGKSTFAEKLRDEIIFTMGVDLILNPAIHSADDWFTTKDGEYKFEQRFLSRAHTETISRVMENVYLGRDVIVANTFINYWEVSPYLWMAKLAGASCIVYEPDVLLENKDGVWNDNDKLYLAEMHKRCTHGVPIETIQIHMTNFHHLEAGGLISEFKQFNTGLI